MPSYAFPPPPQSIEPTAIDELDRVLARLADHKGKWAKTSVDQRIELLGTLRRRTYESAEEWVDAGNRARGIAPTDPASGEEWLGGPSVLLHNIRRLEDALRDVEQSGRPVISPSHLSERPDGRLVARVFPTDMWDRLLFAGFHAEVWMQPGVDRANLADHQAAAYRERDDAGRVSVILGAGNVSSIPPMDALYKLFVENEVCVLKMNPVNEYLGPIFRRIFLPLVELGVFEVVYGGVEVGAHLVHHPQADTLHMTGSDATYDAIVWGPRDGREARKTSGEMLVDKPFSAELGNVTPILVVPGDWSESDLAFQAQNVATMVTNNASFNCIAGKLLVTPEGWPLRQQFIAKVKEVLAGAEARKAYYPGARNRWQAFIDAHADAELLAPDSHDDVVPWTFIGGLDPDAEGEICFLTEPFCGVLHEVALPGRTAVDFLPGAVEFCNDKVWGTLGCMVLIHPDTRKDPASEAAFQDALDDLRYGGIAVNHWVGVVYGLGVTTWGAHPGHTPHDIQSGTGVVHNTFMFDAPQKSVLYGPFRVFPKPPWFLTHTRAHRVGRWLTSLEYKPSVLKYAAMAYHAVLG